ncbi:hypothetical protein AOG23_30985 [Rhizobium acidisoli]|nr:hypothetical protein AOG23_30985 [Rhizobium acidisoli]
MGPDAALFVCRFLFDGAGLFLWGAGAYLCTMVPQDLQRQIWAQLAPHRRIAVACVGVSAIVLLPIRSAMIGNGWPDALNPDMLLAIAFDTTVGTAWCCQIVATILLLFTGFVPGSMNVAATAIVSALLLASLSFTGHAVMNDGWRGVLHQANDVVHLLAGGAWVGALLPVFLILPRLEDSSTRDQARAALSHFSMAGHLAIAGVILSGVTNMLFILDGLPTDWTFEYQRLLTVKIGLVAAMILAAITNRYILVPRIVRHRGSRALAIGTMAEIVLAIAVIGFVAWSAMLEPAA